MVRPRSGPAAAAQHFDDGGREPDAAARTYVGGGHVGNRCAVCLVYGSQQIPLRATARAERLGSITGPPGLHFSSPHDPVHMRSENVGMMM
jgi:hypothetical protein